MSVPVVDLSLLLDSTGEDLGPERVRARENVAGACRDSGAFVVSKYGGRPGLVEEILSVTAEYFALPTHEKNMVERSDVLHDRGYRCHTFPNGLRHETFFWNENHDRLKADPSQDPGPDPWPEQPARFRSVIHGAIEELKRISLRVYRAIALGSGMPLHGFDYMNIYGSLQLHRYDAGAGLAAHADMAPLTIIFSDIDGLEAQTSSGEWVAVPSSNGLLSCMLGDIAMVLSNDRYRTTVHRVAPSDRPRHSVLWSPFFGPDATIGPLPHFCSESEPPRYPMRQPEEYIRNWISSREAQAY